MTQKEIIRYYEENGGLRCKNWTLEEIKAYIKSDLGKDQRVLKTTCIELKNTARIYQR
jgi:hypothetical protein